MTDPENPEQWQEAVDLAEAMLQIDSARQYGLITGGPRVDAERCAELLARGAELGYRPDREAVDAVIGEFARPRPTSRRRRDRS